MGEKSCSGCQETSRSFKALRRINRALDVYSKRLHRECNITSPQIFSLYALAKNGEQTLSELAQDLNLSVSTVNGIIDRLVLRGLVSRTRSKQDQRKTTLSITAAGVDILNTIPELLPDIFTQAFSRLSPKDQENLTQLLEKLANHFIPKEKERVKNTEILKCNHEFISSPGTDYQLH